jgi:hypothetical protein
MDRIDEEPALVNLVIAFSQYSCNDPLMTEMQNIKMTHCRWAQWTKFMMVIPVLFGGVGPSVGPRRYLTGFGSMGESISGLSTKIVGKLTFATG